jgi:hypothetical protein
MARRPIIEKSRRNRLTNQQKYGILEYNHTRDPEAAMANKNRQHFLTLTRPQLIALAVQKKVMCYHIARDKTKGELIALVCDVEGVLTPIKTWPEIDGEARLGDDTHTRGMQEVFAKMYGDVDDTAPRHDDTGIQYRQSEYPK